MATCPACSQTLPDWAEHCQFCGAKVAVSRASATTSPYSRGRMEVPKSIRTLYGLCAFFWIIDGLRYTLSAVGFPEIGRARISPGIVFFILLAGATMVVGFLLLAKVKVAQKAVRVVAWANILLGALNLLSPLFTEWTWWIVLNVVFSVIQVAAGIYMIYAQGVIDLYSE